MFSSFWSERLQRAEHVAPTEREGFVFFIL